MTGGQPYDSGWPERRQLWDEAQWGASVWGEGLRNLFYKLLVTMLPNQSLRRARPLRCR